MATDPMAASQDLSGHVLKPVMDVVGEFGMDFWGSLKHDHPRPQERQKWISTYVEARYEDEEYPPSRRRGRQPASQGGEPDRGLCERPPGGWRPVALQAVTLRQGA